MNNFLTYIVLPIGIIETIKWWSPFLIIIAVIIAAAIILRIVRKKD